MVIKVSYSDIGFGMAWKLNFFVGHCLVLVLPNKGQHWGALLGYLGSYFQWLMKGFVLRFFMLWIFGEHCQGQKCPSVVLLFALGEN